MNRTGSRTNTACAAGSPNWRTCRRGWRDARDTRRSDRRRDRTAGRDPGAALNPRRRQPTRSPTTTSAPAGSSARGDRRAVSDRVWRVLRTYRRLSWWLAGRPDAATAGRRLAMLAGVAALRSTCRRHRFLRRPVRARAAGAIRSRRCCASCEGRTLEHPSMPDAVRLEVPDWLLPHAIDAVDTAGAAGTGAARSARQPAEDHAGRGPRRACRREGMDGITPTPLSPWGLRVAGPPPGHHRRRPSASGLVEIQDEGSQLVAALVDARPGMRVADLCAGAGGKTLAMAMTMQNRGQLVACDVSAARLDGAVRRLRRAGVHNVERHLLEPGDKWAKRRAGQLRPRAGGCALHRHRHLAAQPRRAAASDAKPILPNCCPSRRRSSIRRRHWFAPAGVWSTLPVPCSPRRTRLR